MPEGDERDDENDAPTQLVRSERVEFHIFDTGVGWGALEVRVGPNAGGEYGFSLVWDPLEDIRRFERDLSAGRVAKMVLRGEPGGVEVQAEPDRPEGWVRLRIWLIDFRDDRKLDLEAYCPAEAMALSLRTRTGFLAAEQAQAKRRTLLQRLRDWMNTPKPR